MEYLIWILVLFILIASVLKMSFWKWGYVILFSAVCALFIIYSCQYAVLQSKTQIADYLNNINIKQNMAVLITLETALSISYCFTALQNKQSKKKKYSRLLLYYPGLLLFPVLFYILVELIFSLSGINFNSISYPFALIVLVFFPFLSRGCKWIYSERELRLEVYFLVSLFICIIGLITTVNGEVVYQAVEKSFSWKAIVLSLILFSILFTTGALWNKYKWTLKKKRSFKINIDK